MDLSIITDPKHWRARAAEMRALAELISNPEARAQILVSAQGYERLAVRAEQRTRRAP